MPGRVGLDVDGRKGAIQGSRTHHASMRHAIQSLPAMCRTSTYTLLQQPRSLAGHLPRYSTIPTRRLKNMTKRRWWIRSVGVIKRKMLQKLLQIRFLQPYKIKNTVATVFLISRVRIELTTPGFSVDEVSVLHCPLMCAFVQPFPSDISPPYVPVRLRTPA